MKLMAKKKERKKKKEEKREATDDEFLSRQYLSFPMTSD
jgi:hypothetical protein